VIFGATQKHPEVHKFPTTCSRNCHFSHSEQRPLLAKAEHCQWWDHKDRNGPFLQFRWKVCLWLSYSLFGKHWKFSSS